VNYPPPYSSPGSGVNPSSIYTNPHRFNPASQNYLDVNQFIGNASGATPGSAPSRTPVTIPSPPPARAPNQHFRETSDSKKTA
jgi:hypothetical protein